MGGSYRTGFDAHTHLDFPVFDADRDEVVARAHRAGVRGFAIAAADPADWDRVERVGGAIGAVVALGCHPWWADRDVDAVVRALEARRPDVIGEIGLDGVRGPDMAVQQRMFDAQLALARAWDVPVVVHVVRCVDAVLASVSGVRGVLHGFDGSAAQARRAAALGWMLSVGTSAVRRGRRRDEMLRAIPREHLLLETDCPDRPVPGATRGEPAHLLAVAQAVAEVRGDDPDVILDLCGANARRLFGR